MSLNKICAMRHIEPNMLQKEQKNVREQKLLQIKQKVVSSKW